MNSLKRILKYQLRNGSKSLLGFWLTMVIVNICFAIMNRISGPDSTVGIGVMVIYNDSVVTTLSIAGIGLFALLVYLLVSSYENFYKEFPLAMSFSITRKNYALSLIVKSLFIVLLSSIIQSIFLKLDHLLVKFAGEKPLYDFLFFDSKNDSLIYIAFAIGMLFLSFASVWSLIASLNYRFGYIFWLVALSLSVLALSISSLRHWLGKLLQLTGELITTRIDLIQFLKLTAIIVVFQLLTYLNIGQINLRSKKV